MKTATYLNFVDKTPAGWKTKVIDVRNRAGDYRLGFIAWYSGWREYVFVPESDTEFSGGCLNEIVSQITGLRSERSTD